MNRELLGRLLLSVFDAIYVINLVSRPDRLRDIKVQLSRLGLSFDDPKVVLFPASRPVTSGDFPTRGAKGCFESHLAILRDLETRGLNRVLILEDDADFSSNIDEILFPLLRDLSQSEWDIFLGYPPDGFRPSNSGLARLPADVPSVKLHCYGVTKDAAHLAGPFLEKIYMRPGGHPLGGAMHVDGAYNWFRKAYPDVKTLVSMTPIAHQRSSKTDIHPLSWFDRWPILKDATKSLRRLRVALNSTKLF